MHHKRKYNFSKPIVIAVATVCAAFVMRTAFADPFATCVQGATTLGISRKPNLPDASAPESDFATISAQGKSYIPVGGIAINFQSPPPSVSDIAGLLSRHIAAMKAQNLAAMKVQFLASDHSKIDAFLSDQNVQSGFWASAQAIQSCRLLLVREMGEWIDVWVEKSFSDGETACSRFTVKCAQGQLWMTTAAALSPEAKAEDKKLQAFLSVYGINGVNVVEQ
jgi:hypothetical protein